MIANFCVFVYVYRLIESLSNHRNFAKVLSFISKYCCTVIYSLKSYFFPHSTVCSIHHWYICCYLPGSATAYSSQGGVVYGRGNCMVLTVTQPLYITVCFLWIPSCRRQFFLESSTCWSSALIWTLPSFRLLSARTRGKASRSFLLSIRCFINFLEEFNVDTCILLSFIIQSETGCSVYVYKLYYIVW